MEGVCPMVSSTHSPLLPDPACLHLTYLEASPLLITAVVTTASEQALCPLCQHHSEKE